jgi:argininosuccinate lyase
MKLWGGRFNQSMDSEAFKMNASIGVDYRMLSQDVQGNIAWVRALERAKVIVDNEAAILVDALQKIADEISSMSFIILETDEDVHTAVERRLTEMVGPLGGKLHTGRSRNDQVVTDFRLWVMNSLAILDVHLSQIQKTLIERAELDFDCVLPGYTHLQPAQVILLSHWWLSFFWAIQRDRQKLGEVYLHTSVMPLGSGALAGSSMPIDRKALQNDLPFLDLSQNSLDAVSDRDFALEFLFSTSLIGLHLSKLSEMVIIFTNPLFGFFDLSDKFATGSSLMPQKKNPDLFELTRGKSGTLIGLFVGLLSTLKSLPSTYDKDLQEDKSPVFTSFDMLIQLLPVISGAIRTLKPQPERMSRAITPDLMATDLADYLVQKGIPFRQAHTMVGELVVKAANKSVPINKLSYEDFVEGTSAMIDEDIFTIFEPLRSVNTKNVIGGTAQNQVRDQILVAKQFVEQSFIPMKNNGGKTNVD